MAIPVLQPAIKERLKCFRFTFGELSCRLSLFKVNGNLWSQRLAEQPMHTTSKSQQNVTQRYWLTQPLTRAIKKKKINVTSYTLLRSTGITNPRELPNRSSGLNFMTTV